jgi:hypothetical protein
MAVLLRKVICKCNWTFGWTSKIKSLLVNAIIGLPEAV